MPELYAVPSEYFERIHHVRPRFKRNPEDILLFMAEHVASLEPAPKDEFNARLDAAIQLYPGNASREPKTIHNWRTEISALFGLIEREGQERHPGAMAMMLAEHEDLIEFFRDFLLRFQYPGGHLKAYEAREMIQAGIRFKPARYILEVLHEGSALLGREFSINKAEATHCIFNDLRVTRDRRSPHDTAQLILTNRGRGLNYDWTGDVIRYAGDIIDYMVFGDLLERGPGSYYFANHQADPAIEVFLTDTGWFEPYERLYGVENLTLGAVSSVEEDWFHYANSVLSGSTFEANIEEILARQPATAALPAGALMQRVLELVTPGADIRRAEIGEIGEAVAVDHEKARLDGLDRHSLALKVVKLPNSYSMGYDINSYEGFGELMRFIEVKTTVS
ncbi:MAG TPA: hypothetical protein VIK22_01180, partial [Candidatus Anoxymicrobiaceae bacterium]